MNSTQSSDDDDLAPLAEINVTPLVDVMLVLLIIFMVTAPMLTAGLNYHYAIFDDQSEMAVLSAQRTFYALIGTTSAKTTIDHQAPSRLEPVLRRGGRPAMGRFSSHFDNR